MSKIAFIADVHVGNPSAFGGSVDGGINHRGRQVLDALRAASRVAQDCDALVICGDLFDTSNPSPQMMAAVMGILAAIKNVQVHVLLGNHDMVSDTPGDNALGPLWFLPNVKVHAIGNHLTVAGVDLVTIPFQVGDCRTWFPDEIEAWATSVPTTNRKRVLAFHLGVVDGNTPAFLSQAHDAIPLDTLQRLMKEASIDHAFCGNWHNPGRWGNVHQIGALCPTGWDNPGWDFGRVMVLNTEINNATPVYVPGPRFMTATSMDEVQQLQVEAKRRKCNLYLSLKGEAAGSLEEVRSMGIPARAVEDTSAIRQATRDAAVAVRKTSTMEEALAKYVQAMPLGDGLDREKVKSMAVNYLSRGAV